MSENKMFKSILLVTSLLGVLLISSCSSSTFDSQADYSSAAPRSSSTLIVPPGLTSPEANSNYKMLDIKQSQDGYSLNQIKDMQIVQAGSERWLLVKKKSVNQVWPMMLAYLNQQGLNVKIQNKNIGLIQTDWTTRSTVVPETGVRSLFDWVGWGNMYSLQSQYMYRVNLWENESDTLVFVTDYQMNEVYPGCVPNLNQTIKIQPSDAQATKWMPVPANPQLELAFLVQFMAFAGLSPDQVRQVMSTAIAQSLQMESGVGPAEANLQGTTLVINDQFDRAWWRTGIALERAELGVADKNRSLGEYYVYPLQAQVDNPDPGFLDRLFGDDKNTLKTPKAIYTVKLQASANQTYLTLTQYPGATDKDFAKHQQQFLEALQKQLR